MWVDTREGWRVFDQGFFIYVLFFTFATSSLRSRNLLTFITFSLGSSLNLAKLALQRMVRLEVLLLILCRIVDRFYVVL